MKQPYPKYLSGGIVTGVIILLVSLLLYFLNFRDHPLSKDPANWGQFADYLNAFVSLANLLVIGMLTYAIHRNEQQREREKEELHTEAERNRQSYEINAQKPVLSFEPATDDIDGDWKIINIGHGPAINVIVCIPNQLELYSLQSKQSKPLYIRTNREKWQAYYEDIFGNSYSATLDDYNKTKIQENENKRY